MKDEEFDLKDMFLLVERDFSDEPMPKVRRASKMRYTLLFLPALLGVASATFFLQGEGPAVGNLAYHVLLNCYELYASSMSEIMIQLSRNG